VQRGGLGIGQIKGDGQGRILDEITAVSHLGTVTVIVIILVFQHVVLLTNKEGELIVVGAHQRDPVGSGEVDLTQHHLNGVSVTVDDVNNSVGEIGGVVLRVECVVGPVVGLVELHRHVVSVTGQILPDGGLIVLKAVGVVGGIVPDSQTIADDISFGRGTNGEN
jgi:hypothetical protein